MPTSLGCQNIVRFENLQLHIRCLSQLLRGLASSKEEAAVRQKKLTKAEKDVLSQYLLYMAESSLAISVQSASQLAQAILIY